MNYCISCNMNLKGIELTEKDNKTFCPKCETQVIEINNKRLTDTIEEITNAFYQLNETSVRNNANLLVQHAKTIEQGERKLRTQLNRRKRNLKELQYELKVIQKLAETLKYEL